MTEEDRREDRRLTALLAEYRVLNEAVQSRERSTLLVNSIMIPGSLAIVTLAIKYKDELIELGNGPFFLRLPLAGITALLAFFALLVAYIHHLTSNKLDHICFDRIHEIEERLREYCVEGHRAIYERAKYTSWFQLRRAIWPLFFAVSLIIYLIIALWLLFLTP